MSKLISDRGFPGDSVVKNRPANAGDVGSIPGLGRSPGEGQWQPTLVFLPGTSHGQRSLEGYSPWSREKSQTRLTDETTSDRGEILVEVCSISKLVLYNKAESQVLLPESGKHIEQVRRPMPP